MKAMTMKYFAITCPRGHVGNGRSIDITFAIEAPNIVEANRIAMQMPAVKHTSQPFRSIEISHREYLRRRKKSAYR